MVMFYNNIFYSLSAPSQNLSILIIYWNIDQNCENCGDIFHYH